MTSLCRCGCGQTTPMATRTRKELGHVKGQPLRFINGHNCRIYANTPDGFWGRVDTSGGADGCWPWTGPTDDAGYGALYYDGETIGTHRLAYRLTYGPLPVDKPQVRHTCDNRPCCNPAHLIPGTTQDNTADRQERQRQSRGENRWSAKLTEADIPVIRRRRRAGETFAAIARDYDVRYQTIARAAQGKTWKHVSNAMETPS